MLDRENGKKFVKLGFLGNAACCGVLCLIYVIYFIVNWIFHRYANLYFFMRLADIASMLCFFACAGGFGIMWLSEREMMDFLSCGAFGVGALIALLNVFNINISSSFSIIASFLLAVLSNAYLAAMALRSLQQNRLIAALFGGAFIFFLIVPGIVNRLIWSGGLERMFLVYLLNAVLFFGRAICHGLGFLVMRAEE